MMSRKSYFFLLMALLLGVGSMKGVPAHPGTVRMQQLDGSYVTLRLVGDEWRHFQTTLDGYSVVKDDRGFFVYAEKRNGQLQPTGQVAHDEVERTAAEQAFLTNVKKYQAPEMTEQTAAMYQMVQQRQQELMAGRRAQGNRATNYSNFKGLIILVEFNDKSFSRDDYQDIITDMVNKEDYQGYDLNTLKPQLFTGSVRDYFSDNSNAKFQPQFDIVGPYKVNYSQYECNIEESNKCSQILKAAIDSADVVGNVNFSDYDGDNDGMVDLVFFMIAGNGANYNGNNRNLWWPHRSVFWPRIKKDGVYLNDYASSVELTGWVSRPSTVKIDGIGTVCHEFSHVLGLPDFYDTDYEKSGGESNHPGLWSVMAGGCYENDARTPVGYSLFERYSIGFCDAPERITEEGSYTLEPLSSSFTGYRIDSPVNDEFFLLENRQKNNFKWDAYLPGSGMLVHRVEKPGNNLWNGRNNLNVNPAHNLYEVVRADGAHKNKDGQYISTAADVFPGSKNVQSLDVFTSPAHLNSWSGKQTEWGLKNISMQDGIVTFDVENVFALKGLILPETAEVLVDFTTEILAVPIPAYARYKLKWSSSDEELATVDQHGNVTGVSAGKCNIIVESENGVQAVCEVTIKNIETVGVDELCQKEAGTEVFLKLTDAQVLFVAPEEDVAYVRDATGSIMFRDTGLGLSQNDVLNGMVIVKVGMENDMIQVLGIEGTTDGTRFEISGGEDAEPCEIQLENLTMTDYSDLVVVKAVKLETSDGIYAVSGDSRVRVDNKFSIDGIEIPTDCDGKYFDVTAIYGTEVVDDQVVEELYLMASPVEVGDPTGIINVTFDKKKDSSLYNLHGQRVDASHRGLVIRNGQVLLNK